MKYLCLIYEDEKIWDSMPTDEAGAILGEYQTFTESIAKSGKLLAGEALQPSATATTVRVRNGRPSTSPGPAVDMSEQLGGFYLVEAGSIDEAVEVATRIPSARHGSVEVRPIMSFSAP
ncbi:MAG: YciI family protein [Gemmatimonadaceae bacterium]